MGPLREQAETARKYLALRDELREAEVSLWMDSLDRLREQSDTLENDYACLLYTSLLYSYKQGEREAGSQSGGCAQFLEI